MKESDNFEVNEGKFVGTIPKLWLGVSYQEPEQLIEAASYYKNGFFKPNSLFSSPEQWLGELIWYTQEEGDKDPVEHGMAIDTVNLQADKTNPFKEKLTVKELVITKKNNAEIGLLGNSIEFGHEDIMEVKVILNDRATVNVKSQEYDDAIAQWKQSDQAKKISETKGLKSVYLVTGAVQYIVTIKRFQKIDAKAKAQYLLMNFGGETYHGVSDSEAEIVYNVELREFPLMQRNLGDSNKEKIQKLHAFDGSFFDDPVEITDQSKIKQIRTSFQNQESRE